MAGKRPTTAEALLNAHVRFIADELSGTALKGIAEEEIDEALINLRKLRLGDLVTRAAIKSTARALVIDLELGTRAGNVVADIARALHAHEIHDRTVPGDLLEDDLFERAIERALAMKPLREKMVREIISSPLYTAFASDLLYGGISGYLAQNVVTRNIPGAQSMMKLGRAMLSKATPDLEASIEEGLKKYIARAIEASADSSVDFLLDDKSLGMFRDSARDAWRRTREIRIGEFREDVSTADVDGITNIGYTSWLHLRRTRYFRALIEAAIDCFFDAYEAEPLTTLLDDFGITREIMLAEALRHAPHLIGALKKKKMLEPLIRRRLRAFYQSGTVEAILDGRTD